MITGPIILKNQKFWYTHNQYWAKILVIETIKYQLRINLDNRKLNTSVQNERKFWKI